MKGGIVVLAMVGALLAGPDGVTAQGFEVDVRAVGATSTQRLAGTDLSVGAGFGATAAYFLQPHLALYGGWDWLHFQADQSFAGADMDFEETGYAAGLRFEHPIGGSERTLYRLEAGGTFKHVEIEDDGGDIVSDSGHELGFEVGGGVVFPLGSAWRLTPTVRFRTLQPSFEITGVTTRSDLRYVGFELGVSRRF
jgi:hypothetical protein